MTWKIYKEGQGKWARNSIAAIIAIMSIFAVASLYESLPDPGSVFEMRDTLWQNWLNADEWPFDYRSAVCAPLLIMLLYFGVWQYNRPRWADFLIDTENELKNRVTWPTGKEVLTNSIVVVVAVLIIGAYTFCADMILQVAQDWVYALFY